MINISKEEITNKMFFIREENSNQPIAVIKVGDLLEKEVKMPKGDLISREALKENVALMWGDNSHITESMNEIIDNAPTVEPCNDCEDRK